MLLGSGGVPRYFPSFLANYNKDVLVIALSIAAIGFYIAYMVAEKIISFGSHRGANYLLLKSHKVTLFENQEGIARRGFQRYSSSLASSVFLFLVAVALFWLYPELLIFIAFYVAMAFLVVALLYSKVEKIKTGLDTAPGAIVTTLTNIGFLLAFAFMVGQFLAGDPPGLFVAIISLIMMRQGFSRITGIVNDLRGLYIQRFKLNALFFHGHVLVNEPKQHETNFWTLFRSPQLEEWLSNVLQGVVSRPIDELRIQWFKLGMSDIVALHVQVYGPDKNVHGAYLVKLYNANRSSLAKHEATLLAEDTNLPALKLLSVNEVEGFQCNVMQWNSEKRLSQKEFLRVRDRVSARLMSIEPEKKILSRFTRSRPLLWQRINTVMLERLHTVAELLGREHVDYLERLGKELEAIKCRLGELPLIIVNPDQEADLILKADNGKFVMIHWGRWALEPIGANWPTQTSQFEKLGSALEEAKSARPALHNVSIEDVNLSALMYAFEKMYARQNFVGALKLIPRILRCLDVAPETSRAST
ncbi:hypothetical protein [Billgrantia sp. C5P2]|uniref:hypothetical protein n=1 Tax=Billgrantia sp. C5P2 TaxID=3436239 RepID=UPI003EAA815F